MMKKYNKIFLLLLLVIGFSACEDDIETTINSSAEDGTLTFQLNEPSYSDWTYVLEEENADATMEELTCTQPDYGFTAAVTYTVQVCLDATFADSTYESLATTVTGEEIDVIVSEMNDAIINLNGGSLSEPVETQTVFVRLKAEISSATASPLDDELTVLPAYSNVIELSILPYYVVSLFTYNDVTPAPYYIIGLGDGAWNNDVSGLGASLYPLSLVDGEVYNSDGDGEFTFTGYFEASDEFKLIRDIGSWADQWGNQSSAGVDNLINKAIAGEEPSNIQVPSDGYYTITLNSISNELTIEATSATPETYTGVSLIGDFTSWSTDVEMTAAESTENHIWYTTYTFSYDADAANDQGGKFRVTGDWNTSWGAADFPYGISSGSNILYKTGTYVVFFNDVEGSYYFFEQ